MFNYTGVLIPLSFALGESKEDKGKITIYLEFENKSYYYGNYLLSIFKW